MAPSKCIKPCDVCVWGKTERHTRETAVPKPHLKRILFPSTSRRTTTRWTPRATRRASRRPTCCPPTPPSTTCHTPHSPPPPTWGPGASPWPTCRATRATSPATPCRGPSANHRCCPALVPLPLPPSRSAPPCTPTSSSPYTRALCSTSLSACSRSSPSQSSPTRWGCSPPFTLHPPGSRFVSRSHSGKGFGKLELWIQSALMGN